MFIRSLCGCNVARGDLAWRWAVRLPCALNKGHKGKVVAIAGNQMDICSLCANAVPLSTRRPVFALGSASRSGYETLPRVRRCASFVPRRRFDIVTTGGQQTIKIWTYLLKRDNQTLEGHTPNVSFAV